MNDNRKVATHRPRSHMGVDASFRLYWQQDFAPSKCFQSMQSTVKFVAFFPELRQSRNRRVSVRGRVEMRREANTNVAERSSAA